MTDFTLYDHQKQGIRRALLSGGNMALFWEPGCGKTLASLAIYNGLRTKYISERDLKLLVVCPKSLLNAAWREDTNRFTAYSFALYNEQAAYIADITAINYEQFILDRNFDKITLWAQKNKVMCVVDESSRLKSHKSVTTQLLLELSPKFQHRLCLSGTPMPNSEQELWAQIAFVNPNLVSKSFYGFRNTYFHLERGTQKFSGEHVSSYVLREMFAKGFKYAITPQKRKALFEKIETATHWVKKEDALDLPEKIDETRSVELSEKELKFYTQMKRELVVEIEKNFITAEVAITKMMKLRQAVSGFMYDEEGVAQRFGDSRVKVLRELLEELTGPVIIWCQFREEIEQLEKILGALYGEDQIVTMYGATQDKEESIKKFRLNMARFLLAHPRSAAHGLTFVNCSTQIFYSLDFSLEAYQQARDRTHRIGQRNVCVYYHLIAPGTIDTHIYEVLTQKKTLQEAIENLLRGTAQKENRRLAKKELPESVAVLPHG